ncbi:hypothetical protein [Rhodococcus erythropolis]|uniref:hypothetical protein n=1 Tax=Rhodococcus erythropolis TaxID=1833 RepID=UPI00366CFC96
MSSPTVFVLENGDKITIRPQADCLKIHASGPRIGKLSVEPEGGNMIALRVIE